MLPSCKTRIVATIGPASDTPEVFASWNCFAKEWVRGHALPGAFAILTQRPPANDPESNHRMEIINL